VRPVQTTFRGLAAYELTDGRVRLTIIPAWGAKIAAWRDLGRDREWLFDSPVLPYRLPEYGANYVRDFDVGGFDECFPTVGACLHPSPPWRGVELPDHGEVWSMPARIDVGEDTITSISGGVRLPYRFERSVRLLGDGRVRLDYRASNLTGFPMPFLWSSHALFALRDGMRVELPATAMRVYAAPAFAAHHGDVVPWPEALPGRDLSVADRRAGIVTKLFTRARESWAAVADPADGARFRFDFDPARVTHVGLWINYGGWAGAPGAAPYFNLALEPCIGAADTLDVAVDHWREHGTLAPHGELAWWLEVSVE
jgi:galactose mutarotase-like enzyme